jgi:hypothetical protein
MAAILFLASLVVVVGMIPMKPCAQLDKDTDTIADVKVIIL